MKHIIGALTVRQYTQPQLDETDLDARKRIKNGHKILSGGRVSFESESHPVELRKVELRELQDTPVVTPQATAPLRT